MPNRILKESVCTSESIDALTPQEEVFFYRLLVNCDDFGRMDGRDSVIKARLFPLREISPKTVAEALDRLEALQMVRRYQVGGKPYLQVVNWDTHQKVRTRRGKFPPPQEPVPGDEPQAPREQSADACGQIVNACGQSADACGQSATNCAPNPIQSESESKSESESEAESMREAGLLSAADAARWREDIEAVERQAVRMGMAFAPADRDRAESLMAEYSAPWLLTAMRRAEAGQASCRSWRYIGGILSAWKEKGGIDLVHDGSHRSGEKQGHGKAEGAVCPPLRIRRY